MGSGQSSRRQNRRWPEKTSALTTSFPSSTSTAMMMEGGDGRWREEVWTDIYIVRCATETVGAEGRRQATAIARRFLSRRLSFDAVFSSPWHASKLAASFICQELNIGQERIEYGEALSEMCQSMWGGTHRNDAMNKRELLTMMYNLHQDFHAPGGETQRQVEFRMIEFMNNVILKKSIEGNLHINSQAYFAKHDPPKPLVQVQCPLEDVTNNSSLTSTMESSNKLTKTIENAKTHTSTLSSEIHVNDVDFDGAYMPQVISPYNVLVVSHEMAIKCLLRGILGSSPQMTNNICIDNASITILRHSTHTGWRILRVNDISHLY